MKLLSTEAFLALCQQKEIKIIKTMKDKRPRVLETPQGAIIKFFYPSKKIFSARKNKKSFLNFCYNAKMLEKKGTMAPKITGSFYYAAGNIYIVIYQKIPGENMRALIQKNNHPAAVDDIAKFIANLHQQGIFFRSLHLENIVYQGQGRFALIDVADVYFKRKPLNCLVRYRNLKHLFLVRQDKKIWQDRGHLSYLQHYFQFTSLSRWSKAIMIYLMKRSIAVA